MIEVSAKDFGPIVRGTVELKPLTIFVGPSNTGKSYMATLVYALHRSLGRHAITPYEGFVDYETLKYAKGDTSGLLQGLKSKLGVDDLIVTAICNWTMDWAAGVGQSSIDTLPEEVRSLIDCHMARSLRSAGKLLGEELRRCCGPTSDLRNRRPEATAFQIAVDRDEPLLRANYGADEDSLIPSPHSDWDVSATTIRTDDRTFDYLRTGDVRLSPESQLQPLVFLSLAVENAAGNLFAGFADTCYYFPAARSGIAQGHKAIAGSIVKRSSRAATRPPDTPILPGIVTDFIGHMLDMEQMVGWRGREAPPLMRTWRTQDVVDFLESEVIRGRIEIDPGGGAMPATTFYAPLRGQPETGRFPVDRTSSMVSELAPVVLFLKYLVWPGGLVILEEPESHLHPASQRQMARAMVRLVNAGVKVIITTHSDYFVGQINNLLKLSHASDRKIRKEGYAPEDCLKPDDLSAYHFRMDDDLGGSVVDRLEIDPGFGIDEQEFASVSEALYEETVSLQRIRAR